MSMPSRQQRQRHRRTLGTLESNIIKPVTLDRYALHFNSWSAHVQEIIGYWPADPETFDQLLSEYLEMLWDTGEPRTVASYTLASVHYFLPALRRKLPRAWRLKNIWERLELPNQAEPLSEQQMVAIAGYFLHHSQLNLAAACITGFTCLLRTGELLSLKVNDCSFTQQGCILHLGETKGAKRKQLIDESVLTTDKVTILLLRYLVKEKLPGDYVFAASPSQFRTAWHAMKRDLGITSWKFMPYSLRRGGATWYFAHCGSFSKTMVKGRWEHIKTCKLYLSQSQLALTNLSLPPLVTSRFQQLEQFIRPQLARWVSLGRVEGIRPGSASGAGRPR